MKIVYRAYGYGVTANRQIVRLSDGKVLEGGFSSVAAAREYLDREGPTGI